VVARILTKTDFKNPSLGLAFGQLAAMHASGFPLHDDAAIHNELRAGGCSILSDLAKEAYKIPNVANVAWHAERLANLSRLRSIFAVIDAAREDVLHPMAKADEVLGGFEAKLLRLRQGGGRDARTFQDVAEDVIADMRARIGKPEPAVLLSGFPSADNIGFVFGDGELTILAARPGVGKTSLATQIAMHHASKGRGVLLASLEMRDKDLVSRVLISTSGHNHQLIRTNRIDDEVVADVKQAQSSIGPIPLIVWSPGRVKAGLIHATAATFKASHNIRLLIVDYLGYVRPDDASRERYEQVGDTVKAIRDIGQALEIPVLCLCQLNREADQIEPKLKNLRESGDIEQDADIVAFLHPPDPKESTRIDLIVAKDRQGAMGRVTLKWNAAQTLFADQTVRDLPNYDRRFEQFNEGREF
jgi:replicative DNA helicase